MLGEIDADDKADNGKKADLFCTWLLQKNEDVFCPSNL